MNQARQSQVHPDAESLNAFIEQALPQPERAQILEHMAACRQCRQVVFLAQQAATAADAPATIRPDAWYRNWHLNWRLAWAPELAAFALIVILVIAHYARQRPNPAEMARVTPPPAPVVLPAPAAQQPATEPQASQPVPNAAVKASKKSPAAVHDSPGDFAPSPGSIGKVAGEVVGAGQGYAPGVQATPPVPAFDQKQFAANQISTEAREARTTPVRFKANAAEAQATRSMAPSGAPAIHAKAAIASSLVRSMPYDVALPKAEATQLPSGLAAISIATAQRRTVAIDSEGNLFVRESPVAMWEPVLRQLTGRAVRVQAQQASQGSMAVDAVVQSAPPAFEIVNDSNLVWVSQDGKAWKAR